MTAPYLAALNPEQRRAVEYGIDSPAPLLVVEAPAVLDSRQRLRGQAKPANAVWREADETLGF